MTYRITSQCIECDRCTSICPIGAITRDAHQYQIDSERCNNCVGHYAVPQCWAGCPTNDGCVSVSSQSFTLQSSGDYWDHWFKMYNRLVSQLNTQKQSDYWQNWFEVYSQKLAQQLHAPLTAGVHA